MQKKHQRFHPTIAFLIDSLFDEYQTALWKSVVQSCRKKKFNFISFFGGIIRHRHFYQNSRNRVYDLLSPRNFDGIITCSNILDDGFSTEQIADYYRDKFGSIPLVNIGMQLSRIPSVVIDNKNGMKALLEHLIVHHGCRRIAYIKGPETNFDANERFISYRETLSERGIPYNPKLVYQGDFTGISGKKAVETFFDRRHVLCDALVAANDSMATSAMEEFIFRGIRVPGDLAVAGFDDSAILYNYSPPLTTVKQSVHDIGIKAVDIASDLLEGKKTELVAILPTDLVIRRSCGCTLARIDNKPGEKSGYSPFDSTRISTVEEPSIKSSIDTLRAHSGQGEEEETAVRRIKEKLNESLVFASPDPFLKFLDELAESILEKNCNYERYTNAIHRIFADIKLSFDPARLRFFNLMEETATTMLDKIGTFIRLRQQTETEKNNAVVYRFGQRLGTSITRNYIIKTMKEELPMLGIRNFFVCSYTGGKKGAEMKARLDYYYSYDKAFTIDRSKKEFQADGLIPGRIDDDKKTFELVVYPLFFKKENLGYFVCSIGTTDGIVYEILHGQLSIALKSTEMIEALRENARNLESLVEKRTAELHKTAVELKKTNKKLKELTITDDLTGAYNRRFFDAQFEMEWSRSKRLSSSLGLILIDIDNFKRVNDTYGHLAGDFCLRELARIAKQIVRRNTDFICRYGGEEFVLILPYTGKKHLLLLAEKLRKAVKAADFRFNKISIRFTISLGVTARTPGKKDNPSLMIANADKALYEAKEDGKNCVRYS